MDNSQLPNSNSDKVIVECCRCHEMFDGEKWYPLRPRLPATIYLNGVCANCFTNVLHQIVKPNVEK
jgi:hypothetical protein